MGQTILAFYSSIAKKYKITFFTTFTIAILTHLYKFANTLLNHDCVENYYATQDMINHGRWALKYACGISSYFNLPWFIGVLSCIYIALTAVILVRLFNIKNPVLAIIVGCTLAVSPATTETFFYHYTADGYFLAMLLSVFGVYLLQIKNKATLNLILSILCFCIVLGIYQSYISFAIILSLCLMICSLLCSDCSKKEVFSNIGKQAAVFIAAFILYYVIHKLFMYFTHISAIDYKGIGTAGGSLPIMNGIKVSIYSVIGYFLQGNILKHGLSLYAVLNIIFFVFSIIGIVIVTIKTKIHEKKWALALIVFAIVTIPFFACIFTFVSTSLTWYRPMMLQSLTLLYITTAVIYERHAKQYLKDALCLLFLIIIANNALMANIAYYYMDKCYKKSYADGIRLAIAIEDIALSNSFDYVAILGYKEMAIISKENESKPKYTDARLLISYLQKTILFDQHHTVFYLNETFGMNLKEVSDSQYDNFAKSQELKKMECWPSKKSIAIIGNTLVIKYSNKYYHPHFKPKALNE